MKTLHRLLAVIAIATIALSHASCSTIKNTPPADLVAKADKAVSAANGLITIAETGGKISKKNADKLRTEITLAQQGLALFGKLDFTNARAFAASLAAAQELPVNYAMAIQTALLVYDMARG